MPVARWEESGPGSAQRSACLSIPRLRARAQPGGESRLQTDARSLRVVQWVCSWDAIMIRTDADLIQNNRALRRVLRHLLQQWQPEFLRLKRRKQVP